MYYQDKRDFLSSVKKILFLEIVQLKNVNNTDIKYGNCNLLRWKILLYLLAIVSFPSSSIGASNNHIMVLNSYHQGYEWTDLIVRGIEETFAENQVKHELYIEYLDTKRFKTKDYLQHYFETLRNKYSDRKVDAIIATDDNAFQFLLQYHNALFAQVPVVFCGVNFFEQSMIEGRELFTGVVQAPSIKETIELAMKLQPGARNVVVLSDNTETGQAYKENVVEIEQHFGKLEFIYLDGKDLTHDDLYDRLSRLHDDSIVLLTLWLSDKDGRFIPWAKGMPVISAKSPVPVYGIVESPLEFGLLGGKVQSGWYQGQKVAEMTIRILIGHESLAAIPVVTQSPNKYIFSYNQLKRWKISRDSLPEDSIILGEPPSFYEKHSVYIWSVGIIIIILVVVVINLSVNIIRQQRSEEAMLASHQRFTTVMDSIDAIVYVADMATHEILFLNRYGKNIFGEIEGSTCWQHLQEGQAGPCDFCTNKYLVGNDGTPGEPYIWDFQNTMTGQWFRIQDKAIAWVDGRIVRLEIATDITRHKEAEEESKIFRTISDRAVHGNAISDLEGNFIYINDYFAQIHGYTAAELVGRNLSLFHSEKQLEAVRKTIDALFVRGSFSPTELWHTHKDGTEFPMLMSGVMLKDEKGKPKYLAASSIDITALKQSEKEKITLESQLQQAQKMEAIGTMAGGIAHDFNNILSIIIGGVQMALDDIPAGSQAEYYNNAALQAARRATDLVKQILTFSRKSDQKLIPVSPHNIINEYLKLLRSTIPTTVAMRRHIDPECNDILADPSKIQQVIMNLCVNAVHAMDEKGVLDVRLEEVVLSPQDIDHKPGLTPGPYARLSVSDTGCGMDQETMARIFDPFFTTKEAGEGTGMGLSVVHGIVVSHGGMIKVESKPRQGTTFRVFFPVIQAEPAEKKSEIPAPTAAGTERILFVDDEEAIAEMSGMMLKRLGYMVTARSSSLEALATFKSNPDDFDLVVTDQAMPHMSGAELAVEVLKVRQDMPVILCTGHSRMISEKEAKKIGIKEFCIKPLEMRILAETVRKVLDEK